MFSYCWRQEAEQRNGHTTRHLLLLSFRVSRKEQTKINAVNNRVNTRMGLVCVSFAMTLSHAYHRKKRR